MKPTERPVKRTYITFTPDELEHYTSKVVAKTLAAMGIEARITPSDKVTQRKALEYVRQKGQTKAWFDGLRKDGRLMGDRKGTSAVSRVMYTYAQLDAALNQWG